jgi:ABC-type Zn2+ transport system substrate-binding protein/surface adhesin
MPKQLGGMPGDLQSLASSVDDSDDNSTSSFDDDDHSKSDHDDEHDDDEGSDRDETEEINKLIRKESKDVLMWREIVTGMLVITAALVTITTYVLLSREEVDDFTHGVSVKV